jgi:hypothetical protein
MTSVWIVVVGGFNPSEKYESQLGLFFPIYGKIKNVPNQKTVQNGDLGSPMTQLGGTYSKSIDQSMGPGMRVLTSKRSPGNAFESILQ